MGWWESYGSAFSSYAEFAGRTARGVFWRFFLINLLISWTLFGAALASSAISASNAPYYAEPELPAAAVVLLALGAVYLLATIIPTLAITARRLHDVGRSGWWQLLGLIGLIGAIVVWVMCAGESKGPNQWGAAAGASPSAPTEATPFWSMTQSSTRAASPSASPSELDALLSKETPSASSVAPQAPTSPKSRLDEVLGGQLPSTGTDERENPSSSTESPTAEESKPPAGPASDSAHADLRAMINKRTGAG